MIRPRLMLWSAVALVTLSAGCANLLNPNAPLDASTAIAGADYLAQRQTLAAVCPTPTPPAKRRAILAELTAARVAAVVLDNLATEWERLDAAATKCRGG